MRTTSYRNKIRKLNTKNKTGNSYGITIPQQIVKNNNYENVYFTIDTGEKIREYQKEILETINLTFRELSTEINKKEYDTIRKHWLTLRTEINNITILEHSIILTSGGNIWSKEKSYG